MTLTCCRYAAMALALFPTLAAAQTATSTLSGTVSDEAGGALAGATLTARNAATGATRRATTHTAGRYGLANLEPGTYEMRCELRYLRSPRREVR